MRACVVGGHAWQGGMHSRRACLAGGHVWWGACLAGGMHSRGVCMVGGHAWQEIQPLQQTVSILLECIFGTSLWFLLSITGSQRQRKLLWSTLFWYCTVRLCTPPALADPWGRQGHAPLLGVFFSFSRSLGGGGQNNRLVPPTLGVAPDLRWHILDSPLHVWKKWTLLY